MGFYIRDGVCFSSGTSWIELALVFKGLITSPSVLPDANNGVMRLLQSVQCTGLAIRKKLYASLRRS